MLLFACGFLWSQCFYLARRQSERALALFALASLFDAAVVRPLALAFFAMLVKLRGRGQDERFDAIDCEEAQLLASLFASYKLLRGGLESDLQSEAGER